MQNIRLIIETNSGRKGIKNFNTLEEYIDFMTANNHKIKAIYESDMPYSDKPVKLPSASQSKGWQQIDSSAFGDIDTDGEKGDAILPQNNKGVFKDNASFEVSKSSEKADKAEPVKVEKSPVKTDNTENKSQKTNPNYSEFKYEEKSEDKEDKKEEKSEDKKEEKSTVEESKNKLNESSVQMKENGRFILRWNKEGYYSIIDKKAEKEVYRSTSKRNAERRFNYYAKHKQLDEAIRDYLPRAGFIRDEETNKKQGAFAGQGTDEQLRKAKIIAKVKYAQGDRFGRVSKDDLDNFDEYYELYKKYYGSDPLNESAVENNNVKGKIITQSASDYSWLYNKIHNELGIESQGHGNQDGSSCIHFNATPDELNKIKDIMKNSDGHGSTFKLELNEDTYKSGDETITIKKAPNGKYFNTYGKPNSPCSTCGFDTKEEAEKMLKKHRPTAEKVEELDEDWKSKFKKAGKYAKGALAGAAMAASVAGNAHGMEDPYYDGATQPFDSSYEQVYTINGMEFTLPEIKQLQKEQGLSDEELQDILDGNDPYYDGAKQPFEKYNESDNDSEQCDNCDDDRMNRIRDKQANLKKEFNRFKQEKQKPSDKEELFEKDK